MSFRIFRITCSLISLTIGLLGFSVKSQTTQETFNVLLNDGTTLKYNVGDINKMFFSLEEIGENNEENEIEWVDLGLSVKWAKWNLGANSLLELGEQYAWGETETKKKFLSTDYTYPSHLFKAPYDNTERYIGGSLYDAASARLGFGARMPSLKELTELVVKCDIEEFSKVDPESGKNIRFFKFTGPSGNSIYIQRDYEFWLQDACSTDSSRIIYLQASEYNNWSLTFVDNPYKGKYIRPVKEIELETRPSLDLSYNYDEYWKRHTLSLEVDQTLIDKYDVTCSPNYPYYLEYSGLGFLYSSNPDILISKRDFKVGSFIKKDGKYVASNFDGSITNGKTYYAVPFIVIGGVYYYGNEIMFKAGSKLPVYKVGDCYPNNENPIGVVCYIENEGTHGKIISFDETNCEWDFNWPEYQGASSEDNGVLNTEKIKAVGAVASKWCKNHGDGWYWPARFELTKFCNDISVINNTIKSYAGTVIDGIYWSSTEYGPKCPDLAYMVCLAESSWGGYKSGWNDYADKQNKHKVRAMKKF